VGSLAAVVGLAMGRALLHAARPPGLHSRARLAEIPQRGGRGSGAKSRHGIQSRHGPTASRMGHHAGHGGNLLQRARTLLPAWPVAVRRVRGFPQLRRAAAAEMSLWAGEADVRQMPDPLLQAGATGVRARSHALRGPAYGATPSVAQPDPFPGQGASRRASTRREAQPARSALTGSRGAGVRSFDARLVLHRVESLEYGKFFERGAVRVQGVHRVGRVRVTERHAGEQQQVVRHVEELRHGRRHA